MVGAAPARICVVDDEPAQRQLVARWLLLAGHAVSEYPGGGAFLRDLAAGGVRPDCVVLDMRMPGMDGAEVLQRLRRGGNGVPAVVLTAADEVGAAVTCMRAGASDYLVKPAERGHLVASVERALAEPGEPSDPATPGKADGDVVGTGAAIVEALRHVDRVARSDIPVLVQGETGTGKELFARRIHVLGRRARAPFVAVNCAAIPEGLQESELFGHEKGAFTGASERRRGRFQQAEGGTLFLDEVAEMAPQTQARMLRALQEGTVDPVGSDRPVAVDVRVVSATHVDLRARIAEGRFRADLYYRLAGYPLRVPPLRERLEDLPDLVQAFVHRYAREAIRPHRGIAPEAMRELMGWSWPGNVRELENAVRRALISSEDGWIRPEDLPEEVRGGLPPPLPPGATGRGTAGGAATDGTLDRLQDEAVRDALEETSGHVGKAAERLGIGRATLYRWLAARRSTRGG